jgi:hypothetical protein
MWPEMIAAMQPWWTLCFALGTLANGLAVWWFARARRTGLRGDVAAAEEGTTRTVARAAFACLFAAAVPFVLACWAQRSCRTALEALLATLPLEQRWIPNLRGQGACSAPLIDGLALAAIPLGLGVALLLYALQLEAAPGAAPDSPQNQATAKPAFRATRASSGRLVLLLLLAASLVLSLAALRDFLQYTAFIYPLVR